MSKRVNAKIGRRIAKGGPAGKSPTDEGGIRGTTPNDDLVWPMRLIRRSRPSARPGTSGPGKGQLPR